MSTLGASPDGRTLYYAAAGSVWALPATGGTPIEITDGDSFTVDPDTGDLVVKLDEGARMRLVMIRAGGGAPRADPGTRRPAADSASTRAGCGTRRADCCSAWRRPIPGSGTPRCSI